MQIYLQNGAFFMEPWKLIKTDPDRTATVLNLALQIAANLDIAFEPFLPFSSERLRRMLNMSAVNWERLGNADGQLVVTTVSREVKSPLRAIKMLDRGFEKAIKTRKTVLKTVFLFCSGARD